MKVFIDDIFESICSTIISNIKKSLGHSSGWNIDSVIDHNINISKCSPLACTCYIKFPKELEHPKGGLIYIQNIDDNVSIKCCLVRFYWHNPFLVMKRKQNHSI